MSFFVKRECREYRLKSTFQWLRISDVLQIMSHTANKIQNIYVVDNDKMRVAESDNSTFSSISRRLNYFTVQFSRFRTDYSVELYDEMSVFYEFRLYSNLARNELDVSAYSILHILSIVRDLTCHKYFRDRNEKSLKKYEVYRYMFLELYNFSFFREVYKT